MTQEEFNQLTPTQLAKLTGTDKAVWSRTFNAETNLSTRTIIKSAKRLGVSPTKLFELCRVRTLQTIEAKHAGLTEKLIRLTS